jgi:linoleate 10R-lipoxygenase
MLDVYMSEKYAHHWPEIVRLAKLDDKESREKLRRYAMEACRLSTQSFGLFRTVAKDVTIEEAGTTYNLKAGEEIFVNLVPSTFYFLIQVGANVDPVAFPDPLEVKLDRDPESYVNYGWGPHSCIGKEINIIANTAILKCFALLPGLRRAPGPQGKLKYVIKNDVVKVYLQEDWGSYYYFPTSMFHYEYANDSSYEDSFRSTSEVVLVKLTS